MNFRNAAHVLTSTFIFMGSNSLAQSPVQPTERAEENNCSIVGTISMPNQDDVIIVGSPTLSRKDALRGAADNAKFADSSLSYKVECGTLTVENWLKLPLSNQTPPSNTGMGPTVTRTGLTHKHTKPTPKP